jgi:anaerobic magnesium-protoporphyrin IX monomethyl ester cyclase
MNITKSICLINPRLIFSSKDIFTTGIVYMPFLLAYLISHIKKLNLHVNLIDCFGSDPNKIEKKNGMLYRGLNTTDLDKKINGSPDFFAIYAISLSSHDSLIEIIKFLNKNYPQSKIIILENSQAVTSYSLRKISNIFYESGAHFIATGDLEISCFQLLQKLINNEQDSLNNVPGIGYLLNNNNNFNNQINKIEDLDILDFPSWDMFPLKNYWSLNYAHGPLETKKYLPLLTSRGCPYPCKFCVIVDTNNRKWRKRSPQNVIDEMNYLYEKFGVYEYHIEDVDMTINDRRTKEFCTLLKKNKYKFIWKICAGTKIESIKDAETVKLMAQSGCNYISVSPETGSKELLKKIDKPFDLEKLIYLSKEMVINKIYTQACFILGFPGETDSDLHETQKLIKKLSKIGIDEIAIFIISPVPGSEIFNEFKGYTSLSELNFSPTWRKDYKFLNQKRLKFYLIFLLNKTLNHPMKIFKQTIRFLTHTFKTKMEMTPYRAIHTLVLIAKYKLRK